MLCLILLPASVFLMYYDYQNRQVNYSLGISKGLIRSGTSQPRVSRIPAQLSVLARGLEDDTRRLIAFDRNVITSGWVDISAS